LMTGIWLGANEARGLLANPPADDTTDYASYKFSHLVVLRAAKEFGFIQSRAFFIKGGTLGKVTEVAADFGCFVDETDYWKNEDVVCFADPLVLLEANEAVLARLESESSWLEVNLANVLADIESIETRDVARRCGITTRAVRKRKEKARDHAANGKQFDLFGEVEE
jgi:hypothetical protein